MRLTLELLSSETEITTSSQSPPETEIVNLRKQLQQRSTQLDHLLEECKSILEKKVGELEMGLVGNDDEEGEGVKKKEFKGLEALKILDVNVPYKRKD